MKNANLLIATMLAMICSIGIGMGLMKLHQSQIDRLQRNHEETVSFLKDSFNLEIQIMQFTIDSLEQEILEIRQALSISDQENKELRAALQQNVKLYNTLSSAHDQLVEQFIGLRSRMENEGRDLETAEEAITDSGDPLEDDRTFHPLRGQVGSPPSPYIILNVFVGIALLVLLGAASLRLFYRPRKWKLP